MRNERGSLKRERLIKERKRGKDKKKEEKEKEKGYTTPPFSVNPDDGNAYPDFCVNPDDKQQSICVSVADEMPGFKGQCLGLGLYTFLWRVFFTLKATFSLSLLVTYHAQSILLGFYRTGLRTSKVLVVSISPYSPCPLSAIHSCAQLHCILSHRKVLPSLHLAPLLQSKLILSQSLPVPLVLGYYQNVASVITKSSWLASQPHWCLRHISHLCSGN